MFNTLQYTKKLEAAGITRDQAEAHVQIIAEIIEGDLVTKNDLKTELKDFENRLLLKLGAMMGAMLTISIGVMAIVTNFIVRA